jgi:Alpha/beta hydrolase of unknown function (DUF900)
MAHYITVPVNENGVIFDPTMNDVIKEAMAVAPFGFRDVYIYSHGWCTNSDTALNEYNKFSVDLARLILMSGKATAGIFAAPPQDSLGIGIHWPSEITEDPNSPLNDIQLITFYTMEHRADAVGKNAVYTMIRLILAQRDGADLPVRIFMIGHSFGCKVVLSALQDLKIDIDNKTIPVPPQTEFNVVLLEAATDNDNLEPGDIYGDVSQIADLRLLLTTSSLDHALGTWFPLAGKLANLFHAPPAALGFAGPSTGTCASGVLGVPHQIKIVPGFTSHALAGVTNRFIVADLSPVHQARVDSKAWSGGGASGSHSDISFAEVYELICGFFFRVT